MSVARKILSNTLWQIVGKAIVALLSLGVVKMSTGYLSVEGFGEYTLIYEFLAFFGIAADLGLYTIAVKEISENEEKTPQIIGNILTLRTLMVALTMIAAVIVVFAIPKYADTRVPLGVAIASITTFFTIINGTLTSVLQSRLQMHWASITQIFGKIISVGLMAYIIFWGYPADSNLGFYMLVVTGIIGNFAMLLGTYYFVRKITPLEYHFDFQLWKRILVRSLPYGLALILNTAYFRINSILISMIRGQEEVAIYAVAMRMLEQLSILPLYFMNSVLPVLTKSLKENSDRHKTIIKYAFDFLTAISIPLVVGGFLLAYPIVFIVSTPDYLSRLSENFYGSDIAFKILVFASLFQFLNVLFSFILIAKDRQARMLYINAAGVAFNVIFNLILIPQFGFRGAAFTSVICELIVLILTFSTAKKYVPFSLNFKNLFKIFFSSLVMGAAIYLVQPVSYGLIQNWNVLVLVPFGGLVYIAMLLITKVVDKEMIALLKKPSIEVSGPNP